MAEPMQERQTDFAQDQADERLLQAAYHRNLDDARAALGCGANVDSVHEPTGLSPLHIAVGNSDFLLCRYLIEECGAAFFPDGFGRWPTLVAIECGADEDLADYIAEQEALFLQKSALQGKNAG